MIDHDRLFKELLTTFFVEFIELFFPAVLDYLDRESIEFLNQEIFTDVTAGEKHEADLIVKARFQSQESYFLINVEPFADNRGQFGARMFRYFARLWEKYALPVYPILLLSFDRPLRPEPTEFSITFPDLPVMQFNYRVVQLNQLNWRNFVDRPNPVASALMAKMQITQDDRPRVKLECLRLLATLNVNPAKMQLISGFVDTYLRLNAQEEQVFQTQLAQLQPQEEEPIMEIVTSWMEQGIERGQMALILRQLPRRIGQGLTSALENQIRQLPLLQLEALAEALLDFSTVEDLQQWLEEQ